MDNNDYNDKGFKFIPDIALTKYVQEEKYMSDGHIQKGIPGMLVLNVYHKENGHVTNLLYNTKTQTPRNIVGSIPAEFKLVDYPTMDDRSVMNLKSSDRMNQEVDKEQGLTLFKFQ